jgi:hypothetical protein
MPKPPQMHLETEAEYDWRMSQQHPERYPFDASKHPEFFARIQRQFWFWWRVGELFGWWMPLIQYAKLLHFTDDEQ